MNSPYTLGVSGLRSGFAVSLFDNDSLLFAIEEDKLRRSKGAGIWNLGAQESRAVATALSFGKVRTQELDHVVYTPRVDATEEQIDEDVSYLARFLDRHHSIRSPVTTIDHIEAQMAFASAVEPQADGVLMVGKTRAAQGRVGEKVRIQSVSELDIVRTTERLAQFLALNAGEIHHLENMARLGEPRFVDQVAEAARQGSDSQVQDLERVLGKARLNRGEVPDSGYFDVAASIHAVLKRRVCQFVASAILDDPDRCLALCGGVFHSWSLNDALATEFPQTQFSISFAPGNAGCAIGGVMAERGGGSEYRPLPFLGPRYSRDEVKAVLDNCKTQYAFHSLSDTQAVVCDALAAGKMVGWFGGRCEFGLRALGARSVFTNPANPYACDNLSSYLKKRPSYMSYAVVMTDETAPVPSPFMSRSTTLPEYFGENPVRLQTVSKATVPALHQLLAVCRERLSIPALLNTSLNYFDEPIACAPRDAVKTFYASGLDMLVMENFVLSKS